MTFPAGEFSEAQLYGLYVDRKTITFTAGGDGALGQHALFTVSGCVHVVILAHCTTNLEETGATATISVGTDGVVDGLQPVTNATDIDDGEIWAFDTAPSDCEPQSSVGGAWVSDSITYNVVGNTISAGVLNWCCFWTPVTDGATVVAV